MVVLSVLKECQFRLNHKHEDMWIAFLRAWGRTEQDIRDGITTVEEVYSCIDVDLSSYDERERDLNELENMEIPDTDVPWGYEKMWFCLPECGWWCHGKEWSLERSNHIRGCPHWQKLPSLRDYRHMSSRCACCITPDSKLARLKKPWGTKFRKVKATKCKRVLRKLIQKKKK